MNPTTLPTLVTALNELQHAINVGLSECSPAFDADLLDSEPLRRCRRNLRQVEAEVTKMRTRDLVAVAKGSAAALGRMQRLLPIYLQQVQSTVADETNSTAFAVATNAAAESIDDVREIAVQAGAVVKAATSPFGLKVIAGIGIGLLVWKVLK